MGTGVREQAKVRAAGAQHERGRRAAVPSGCPRSFPKRLDGQGLLTFRKCASEPQASLALLTVHREGALLHEGHPTPQTQNRLEVWIACILNVRLSII